MRLETLPLILGVLLALVGLALLFDAWAPDNIILTEERRLRPRRDRDRKGEALVALGALAMSVTFLAGDTWRYSIVAVIAGSLLLIWGAKRSSDYLRGVFSGRPRPRPAPKFIEGSRRIR
jgi:hypothetical protein